MYITQEGEGKGERMFETYSDLRGDQVDLVQYKHQMFVRRLCPNVLLDGSTTGAVWITGVEDMKDYVGRINDLATMSVWRISQKKTAYCTLYNSFQILLLVPYMYRYEVSVCLSDTMT